MKLNLQKLEDGTTTILTLAVFDWSNRVTDRQPTDGQTDTNGRMLSRTKKSENQESTKT